MKNIIRYIVTEAVSIPVCRIASKGEAYKYATKAGCGVVDWYSAINDYALPVNRDRSDKTQVLQCDEDCMATLYGIGIEYVIAPYEEINLKDAPTQAATEAILISHGYGYDFWSKEQGDIKIFVTYDKNGLIDTHRFDNWTGKPFEGETEIMFSDLQSKEEHDLQNLLKGEMNNE